MIGRPTVQPNCHYSMGDYLYDVLGWLTPAFCDIGLYAR
jgi:hypothetical protein